ncbi:MAG: hypothetical protein Faunusvirus7_18 [Faunusvirus sp.]|jgi:hypothetical protein|uniref:Ubiquitin-like domain-containing protein n=1 Tax=Faunusvirus sp. TaxID=2487766 RepID=A0A3G4ZWQ0_9VIRU|nr:MAG: hypothetical protein Faunusvirus7_18 [Faunusvirus sp.]
MNSLCSLQQPVKSQQGGIETPIKKHERPCQLFLCGESKTVLFDVSLGDSLQMLKNQIADKTGLPVNKQKLRYQTHVLYDDNATLQSYGIVDFSNIWMDIAFDNIADTPPSDQTMNAVNSATQSKTDNVENGNKLYSLANSIRQTVFDDVCVAEDENKHVSNIVVDDDEVD